LGDVGPAPRNRVSIASRFRTQTIHPSRTSLDTEIALHGPRMSLRVCRIVSSWYVKKANYYHDVTNLQVRYQPHDIKQVIVHRMREAFPKWAPSEQLWRDFFKVLLDPPVNKLNPEMSIPVWSGKRVCLPANPTEGVLSRRHRDGERLGAACISDGQEAEAGLRLRRTFLAYVIPRDDGARGLPELARLDPAERSQETGLGDHALLGQAGDGEIDPC
jgi:hypothetical protein